MILLRSHVTEFAYSVLLCRTGNRESPAIFVALGFQRGTYFTRNSLCSGTKGSKLGMGHTMGFAEQDQAQIFSSGLKVASDLKEKR